jgi:hypothetical protein
VLSRPGRRRSPLLSPLILLALPCALAGQDSLPPPPRTISLVVIQRENIFGRGETTDFISKLINRMHATTRVSTIRRELLFHAGERYDSARVAESERNLRRLGVFREVAIDTVHRDTSVIVRVQTADGWSTCAGNERQFGKWV